VALSSQEWNSFLAALGPEPGERYEQLRRRLVVFFAARRCAAAEDLVDVSLDRAAKRIAEGVQLEVSVESYVLGVARNVAREEWKKPVVVEMDWGRGAAVQVDSDPRVECLEECLKALPEESRKSIERFYESRGAAKIRGRQELAAELGLDVNALRVRMHRVRAKLEICVGECCDGNEAAKGAISKREF
jgi:DNA-directed RNA polymerase specialized sigma24 family protein